MDESKQTGKQKEPIEREKLIGYIVLMLERMRYENIMHLYRIAQRMH